jgi:nitrite reductase (NADH) small subunit
MPSVKVQALDQLPPGSLIEVEVRGSVYALCNVSGQVRCLQGTCPHAGGPLGQGNLDGEQIVCPWHAWGFDSRTGVADGDEDLHVQTFPVSVISGEIFIDVP